MVCKSIFVTATGTDIGKTYISALLVKKLRDSGFNCGYYKPALSGAIKQPDGSLLPGDCDFVVKNFMILYLSYKEMQQGGKIKLITKKVIPTTNSTNKKIIINV